MAKILLIEDDKDLSNMIAQWLRDDSHVVEVAADGLEGLDLLKFYSYDLAVVDWELPNLSGPEICKTFRARGGKTPILMLTGKSTIDDKAEGFQSGADDYLTKPFEPRELTMRLKAMLRRPEMVAEALLKAQDLELDTTSHVVRKADKPVHLMPKEFALLEFLMRHPNQPFSADAILNRLWPSSSEVSTELVKVYIARLRRKVDTEKQPTLITTVHGLGYKLNTSSEPTSG
jgi:DNA-binding response OmpR family regulator